MPFRTGSTLRIFLILGAAAPAAAQGPIAGTELALVNRYQWRGVRRSDSFVLQSNALLGWQAGAVALTAGGFATFELRESDGVRASDLAAGHWGPGEENAWLSAEFARPGWSLSGGVVKAWYTRADSDATTEELFLRVERIAPVISPRIELWHDPGPGRGSYAEAALSRIIANPMSGPGVNLVLTGLTGFAFRQGGTVRHDPALPGFTRNGVTHAALQLGVRVTPTIGPVDLKLDLTPQLQVGFDPATKRRAGDLPGRLRPVRFWMEFAIGFSLPGHPRQ